MDLWSLLVLVIVLGFIAWLATLEQTPLPANFKWLISTVCWVLALVLVVWAVLMVLGVPAALRSVKVP
jgi:cytochrome c oxidase assembly factor CtaG